MSKHTPGPWEIASDPDGISSPRVIAPGLNDVCVICGAASNESAMADARLIAAAPDLLEALKSVVTWMDSPDESAFSDKQFAKCKKAITKATGGV